MTTARDPLAILVAALGGQGGGVLADWIVHAARGEGLAVQATSTPGVAQRTGATTYYIEIAELGSRAAPAFGLAPVPGRVDVLVCAEMLEAARMLERGMSTPSRTTVIASTHRVYTNREKMNAADGRYDTARIAAAVGALSRRNVLFDMDDVRLRQRSAISAALFGALAGSGALPMRREACERAIVAAGKGVEASLAAFAEAFDRASAGPAAREPGTGGAASGPARPELPAALATRVAALPPRVAEFARPGAAQVAAYQDARYATRYLERVESVVAAERSAAGATPDHDVAREVARHLALWMCYDDVIRVAGEKARASRFERIRREAGARDGDIVRVHECLKPGAVEIAAILPRQLGAWLERRAQADGNGSHGGRAVRLQTSAIAGIAVLRVLAALRPLRPHSLRFSREQQEIGAWLTLLERALAGGGARTAVALELARLPRLRKGYGDTFAASRARFEAILAAQEAGPGAADPARVEALREAVAAAIAAPLSRPTGPKPGGTPRPSVSVPAVTARR